MRGGMRDGLIHPEVGDRPQQHQVLSTRKMKRIKSMNGWLGRLNPFKSYFHRLDLSSFGWFSGSELASLARTDGRL
jgi:hypothetical protein